MLAKAAVAFVDVLGMQKLLRTRSLLSVANGILRSFASRSMASVPILSRDKSLISEVVQHTGMRPANIVTHLFVSDTLLITCLVDPWERTLKKAAVDAIWHLALMVAQLMALNALDGIWLRGAIAYGDCLVRPTDPVLLLGEPLIEASVWEKRQEWSGGMLTPSAVLPFAAYPRALHALTLSTHSPLVKYEIPVKPGEPGLPSPSLAINWCAPPFPFLDPDKAVTKLKKQTRARADIAVKIRNTIAFCEFMHTLTNANRKASRRGS